MSDTTSQSEITFYTTKWCGDCRRSRKVFESMGVTYHEIDIEKHPEAAKIVSEINHGSHSVPTIIFPDGSILVEPSNAVLEQKLTGIIASR